jgi:integrase
MLANRLNYESDRMMQALATGGLTPQEGKLYLDAVCRDELQRITRQRLVSRMDAVVGDDEIDRRHDWATGEAWKAIATRGINVQLTPADIAKMQAAGATDADIYTLLDALDLQVMDLNSDAGTARMLRRAKDVLDRHLGTGHSLNGPTSALAVLMLRQLTTSAKAAAWHTAQAGDGDCPDAIFHVPFRFSSADNDPAPPAIPQPVTAPESPHPAASSRFTTDPTILSVAERVNANKSREDCTVETQKQILSTASLFTKVTGVADITGVEQMHLSFFKVTLENLPTSYGKSSKDAERSIEEILKRGEGLPDDKVGLSARTINGHLDRLNLMIRKAKSEGLSVHPTIDIGLLRVPEKQRARDKRRPFEPHEVKEIFLHPIWKGCRNTKRRHLPGPKVIRDAQYWGPLLGVYTGARREELLGLAPEDVSVIDGVPCISIRINAHRGLKNPAAARIVPIHDHLIELGFLDYAHARKRAGEVALFPELASSNGSDSFGDKFFYNWDKVLDVQLGAAAEGLSFHCFRHYVIAFLKTDTSVTEKERRDLVGHVGNDVHNEVYDKATAPGAMARVVNLIPRVF